MPTPSDRSLGTLPARLRATLVRALKQFLAVPLIVVLVFVATSVAIYFADDAWSRGHVPKGLGWLGELLGDSKALSSLLSTVASSIITVTSITFSLLLIALQQGASALSTQVTDQFLMRRTNQFFFGFFVGLSVYVLLTLVTASEVHRPIFGTSVALILTIAALCMIVVMIYSTIDQMRPGQIVRAIHTHILSARDTEMAFLAKTRRSERAGWQPLCALHANSTGYVAAFEIAPLEQFIAERCGGAVEILLDVRIGSYMAFRDRLATVRAAPGARIDQEMLKNIEDATREAIVIDDDRDLRGDPRYGIYQLSTIAWTSISTAKSNPSPGRAVINALRDIIMRWSLAADDVKENAESAIVYHDNSVLEAINALEMIVLVSSESIQAQTLTDALNSVARLLEMSPQVYADRLVDVVGRALSSLGEHVLTRDLELALNNLAMVVEDKGYADMARQVRDATALFAQSVGILNSRSTRVPPEQT